MDEETDKITGSGFLFSFFFIIILLVLLWRLLWSFCNNLPSSFLLLKKFFSDDYKTWRFPQLFDFESFKHIFCNISLAMFKLSDVFEPWSLFPFWPHLLPLLFCFFSRVSFNLLCFSMPTSNSSTLCCIPDDVSINFESLDAANDFPSGKQ